MSDIMLSNNFWLLKTFIMTGIADQNRWQRPQQGRYKCNIDASFSVFRNRTSIGICLRKELGAFVLAKTMSFSPMYSVATGEATGLFQALQLIHDMQFDNVDFLVYFKKQLTLIIQGRCCSEFGYITTCRVLFSAHFTNSQVEFYWMW